MAWEAWVLVVFYVFTGLVAVLLIDRPRKPTTRESAAVTLVLTALFVWLVLRLAGVA